MWREGTLSLQDNESNWLGHGRFGVFLVLSLFVVGAAQAAAQPTISSLANSWTHGNNATIQGSGFGSKTVAAPVQWDNGEDGTNLSSRWDFLLPNCGQSWDIGYTSTIRGIQQPHSRSTKYISGAHGGIGSDCGYNVGIGRAITVNSMPSTSYFSYYLVYDTGWVPDLNEPKDNNDKLFTIDDGHGGPYAGEVTTNITHTFCTGAFPCRQLNTYDGGGRRMSQDTNWGTGADYYGGVWIKIEIEVSHDTSANGFIRMWESGALVVNYSGPTRRASDPAAMTVFIGGYNRNYPNSNNRKYFDDVYFDQCSGGACPRVLLCQKSTYSDRGICENQRATLWSNSRIDVAVNAGRFINGSQAYLFVCDSNSRCNANGVAVNIGSTIGNGQLTAPKKLRVL